MLAGPEPACLDSRRVSSAVTYQNHQTEPLPPIRQESVSAEPASGRISARAADLRDKESRHVRAALAEQRYDAGCRDFRRRRTKNAMPRGPDPKRTSELGSGIEEPSSIRNPLRSLSSLFQGPVGLPVLSDAELPVASCIRISSTKSSIPDPPTLGRSVSSCGSGIWGRKAPITPLSDAGSCRFRADKRHLCLLSGARFLALRVVWMIDAIERAVKAFPILRPVTK